MREVSFYILLISVLIPVIDAYRKSEKIYQLPFLYSMAVLVYILPTLFGIKNAENVLSDVEYIRYTLFAVLCFWSAVAGYNIYKVKESEKKIVAFDEKKMSDVLYFFIILSCILIVALSGFDVDQRTGGLYAVLLYPARFLRPATIMLFCLYLLKPSKNKLFFLIISFLFSLKIIIIDGRRSEVFNLFITIIFPLFFIKIIKVPRTFIIPGILASIFIFTFLPAARVYTREGKFSQVLSLSPAELILSQVNAEGTNEVVEAAKNMEVAARTGKYNYGSTLYNGFIGQFASKTFFGGDFKNSLLIEKNLDLEKLRGKYAKDSGDQFRFYLASTGFASCFYEFGYAGFILFFLFGMLMKRMYSKAVSRKDICEIFVYCFYATFILFSIYDSIITIPVFLTLYYIVYIISKRFSVIHNPFLSVS